MAVPNAETDRRVVEFAAALRAEGFRITHQRLEVIHEIAATDSHPDVETVYRGVRARVPTISLDTVYRTLATLAEMGLITRVNSTSGVARYDANSAHHHHFVCTRCGAIADVESQELDHLSAPHEVAAFGLVDSVEVQLKGVCHACAAKAS